MSQHAVTREHTSCAFRHVMGMVVCILLLSAYASAQTKVINWGNATPLNQVLVLDHYHMQRMPFDGIILTPGFEHAAFGTLGEPMTPADADYTIAIAKQLNWTRFTDNFLGIRMYNWGANYGTNGIDWYDNATWDIIAQSWVQIGRVLKDGGFKGILLDTEPYAPSQLDYTLGDWQIGRTRGQQIMQALKQSFPDVKIMSTFGHVGQSQGAFGVPVPGVTSGFLDGLLLGSDPSFQLIDGMEGAYAKTAVAQFEILYDFARDRSLDGDVSSSYTSCQEDDLLEAQGRAGFGNYTNFQSPNGTAVSSIINALSVTDEYVWVYSDGPYGYWRDDSIYGRNWPAETSVADACAIATARGGGYEIEFPAPEPVYAEISESIDLGGGMTQKTIKVVSFKGMVEFSGLLITDTLADEINIETDVPVADVATFVIPTGGAYLFEGTVTSYDHTLYPVSLAQGTLDPSTYLKVRFDFEPRSAAYPPAVGDNTEPGYLHMDAQLALGYGYTYDGTHGYGMNTGYSVGYGGTNYHWNYDYPSWTVGDTYYETDLRLRDGSNLYGDTFKVEVPNGDYYVNVVGGLAGVDNDSERFLINGTYFGCDDTKAAPFPYTYFWEYQTIPPGSVQQHSGTSYFNIIHPGDSPTKGYKAYLHVRRYPLTVTDGLIQITNNAHAVYSGVNFVEIETIVTPEPTNCPEVWAGEYGIKEDLDKDCDVDLADFALLESSWLRCNDPTDTNCEEPWTDPNSL